MRLRRRPTVTLEQQPDALPKQGLFSEPVRVSDLRVLDPETLEDGSTRVSFMIEVRDADDQRCSEFSVEVRVTGPERSAVSQGTTDLFGRIRFRMTGPPGDYSIEVLDVGALGVPWDPDAGPREVSCTV